MIAPVPGAQPSGVSTGLLACATAAAAAAIGAFRRSSHRRSSATSAARAPTRSSRACGFDYGEDLSVLDDSFIVLGLAHCFEQGEGGKLKGVFVLEPVSASTVEVVDNGAATSYETFIGTTVGEVLKQDATAFPAELLCGREVQWADDLKFRTGCAARTWMRDHARDVVRLMVPMNEVRTGFSTSTEHKRILNFVNEVKDSDNIKQDMSIDVYGREDEEESKEGGVDSQIAELYNV